MSDALTTGANRVAEIPRKLFGRDTISTSQEAVIATRIASDPGVRALVEACQYVADPCDQDFRTANDKAIAALKLWENCEDPATPPSVGK